ncbi:hypothetical protein [Sporosalibacterium faouarense]|nr:hypothetical protein [Sporosalibacterium faouarense]
MVIIENTEVKYSFSFRLHERVIIALWWESDVFANLGNETTYLSKDKAR